MEKTHIKSGITIETSVIFYEEIRKYSPGVVLINQQGIKTNRIAPSPTMYSHEKDAEEASFEIGKRILSSHLSGIETLFLQD